MPLTITRPTWRVIEELIRGSKSRLIICSPWISGEGVRKLAHYLAPDPALPTLEIWTRLAEVLTDSKGIMGLAKTLQGRGTTIVIRDSGDLHAKIYYADDNAAVFGSANLGAKGMDDGLEIVATTTDAAEVSQVKAVLNSIEPGTQVVSLEDLDYFNTNQRPELEEAEGDSERPNIVPVWRRNRPIPVAATSEGRRAFLVGEGPRPKSVQLIVKMALWGKRSINVYDMIDNTRTKSYPASDEAIEGYRAMGHEVEEPYLAEGETDLWIEYGIESAKRLGLGVERIRAAFKETLPVMDRRRHYRTKKPTMMKIIKDRRPRGSGLYLAEVGVPAGYGFALFESETTLDGQGQVVATAYYTDSKYGARRAHVLLDHIEPVERE